MAAMLRLPRSDGFALTVPAAAGRCETCREAPATAGAYCGELCRLFDVALAAHRAALADGGSELVPVIGTRTVLRAVAAVYDVEKVSPHLAAANAAAWYEDVAAGLLAPIRYDEAIAAVYARLAAEPPASG